MKTPAFNSERNYDNERVTSVVFGVSPQQAAVIGCLLSNSVVPGKVLAEYVGGKTNIKIIVSQTRTKLREFGFNIESRVNLGYWLTPEDKAGIEKALSQFVAA